MLGLALFLTLGTLVILVFPPMVFSHVEGWSFSEGFYFAFITLSTIGFGDYVVGENKAFTYLRVRVTRIGGWGGVSGGDHGGPDGPWFFGDE